MLEMLVTNSATFADKSLASTQKPLIVILIGPPGAGKGTHAGPLSQQLHLPHISTGDLFRENIRNQTILGQKAREFIDQGQLVPDELVLNMLFERVAEQDCKHGYILDGFPRTLSQAQALDERLADQAQLVALNFEVPDSVIIERISGRFICKQCGRPYHKTFDPPPLSNSCETCESPLYQRDDDKQEIIAKRLEVYHKQSQPVISYFAEKEQVLHQIDGLSPKEKVYADVVDLFRI
ncbi:MAG: adenylate kinase [Chlamydiales bacterium]|nr:adenylate kinase [Chlamydiales bacterium]